MKTAVTTDRGFESLRSAAEEAYQRSACDDRKSVKRQLLRKLGDLCAAVGQTFGSVSLLMDGYLIDWPRSLSSL